MKKLICLAALFVVFTTTPFAQKEKDSIEATIVHFFDGLSEFNNDKMRDCSTSDFLLLEDGEVWNLDTLINKITPRKKLNIQRINKFQFIKTEQNGKVAWVSYYNTADFRRDDKQQTIRWLESVVLTKEGKKWRIKQMHSTKLK